MLMQLLFWLGKIFAPAVLLGFCLFAAPAMAAATPVIKLGIFPNLSMRLLLETYRPLAEAIGKMASVQVELHSAPDFRTFHQRTLAGEYDLVITAPHLAWLAWKRAGYRPLLAYDRPVQGIIVVRKDSHIKKLADLKGRKRIATADELAIVVLRMERSLERVGLKEDQDFICIDARTHNNAALQLYEGKVDAAIIGALPYRKLPEHVRKGLRVISESEPMPSQIYLAGNHIEPTTEARMLTAVHAYMVSPEGKRFLEAGGFGGVHRLTRTELNRVADDARRVERLLNVPATAADKRELTTK